MTQQPGIEMTDVLLSLESTPGTTGKAPFQPVVQGIRIKLSDDTLSKLLEWAVALGRDRAPVDIAFRSARFIADGAEIVVEVSKGRFFKTDVRALVGMVADDAKELRVDIKEIKALGKLPIDAFVEPVVDKALAKASTRPGISRAPGSNRALLIDPAVALAALGLSLRFQPEGLWQARTTDGALSAHFRGNDS